MKILIKVGSSVRSLDEGYANEQQLQEFLRVHADLMPMDEIRLGTPPLLCIGWEVGVASGSQDLLYIDENAMLTVVETKLKYNPEARRAVVGQVLEYASQVCTWTSAKLEEQANKFFGGTRCLAEQKGITFEQALRHFLDRTSSPRLDSFSYNEFLQAAVRNLQQGRIRLVIAIDEPPDPLVRTVEFVNRFSQHFEMYLIQLKHFYDQATGYDIFVPALFGQAVTVAPCRQSKEWNWEEYKESPKWSDANIARARVFIERMQRISSDWPLDTRFGASYVGMLHGKSHIFGVDPTTSLGFALYFRIPGNPKLSLPSAVVSKHSRNSPWFWLAGEVEGLTDDQLRQLCEASAKEIGFLGAHDV